MSKHTPGPWVVTGATYGAPGAKAEAVYVAIEDEPNHVVCHIYEKNLWNARLIAAAPELLEALRSIENDDGRIPKATWELRNAAIAKAEEGT